MPFLVGVVCGPRKPSPGGAGQGVRSAGFRGWESAGGDGPGVTARIACRRRETVTPRRLFFVGNRGTFLFPGAYGTGTCTSHRPAPGRPRRLAGARGRGRGPEGWTRGYGAQRASVGRVGPVGSTGRRRSRPLRSRIKPGSTSSVLRKLILTEAPGLSPDSLKTRFPGKTPPTLSRSPEPAPKRLERTTEVLHRDLQRRVPGKV